MSDTTINLCENMSKSVKTHFSGNTEMLGFLKVYSFIHGVQNSFSFLNW